MGALPTGTVTFLFTDIEGSTRLLEQLGGGFGEVLDAHHRLIRTAIEASGGVEISTEGDAFFVAFPSAPDAVAAVALAQKALAVYAWPHGTPLRVRMGLHTGEGALGGDNYVGLEVHRAARITSAAHGGQVLLSEATRSLTQDHLPRHTRLIDLGQHRLKDLSRREHLYQLAIEGLETSFPALRTLESVPNNLPVYLTSFVGRQREIDDLSLLIARNRVLTLRGPGGIGKTRLATQASAALLEEFQDGIWMVDLSATNDADLVPTLVAEAMGVRDIGGVSGRPLTEVLGDYAADKRMLLLMDNCEHVLDSSSRLIAEVLRRGELVHIVATSREALNVPGTQYTVPSLGQGSVTGDSEAVQLFVERARQANPSFWVDGEDVEPVVEITRRLDGLPLAIELAAARVNVLTPQQILDRLEDRFALLKGTRMGAPERHETLLAAMDWSYDLLTKAERETLQRLSVFSGWTLEAAEAVLGDDADSVDLLGSLADRSLVEVGVEGDHHRYRLLETVRHYALRKLAENGNEPEARSAHAEYFLAMTEAGEEGVRGPEQAAWIQRLKHDHDNVRSAIGWAMETGKHDLALRVVSAMSWYWFIDGYWQGPLQLFRRVYEASEGAEPLLRARAVYKSGGIAVIWGWYDEMTPLFEEAYDTLVELGDDRDVAYATHFLGDLQAIRGDPNARRLLGDSISMFDALGDEWGKAFSERWLGSTAELSGDTRETIDHQRASVADFTRLGDRWAASWMAFVLGFNLVGINEFDAAREAFERGLELVAGIEGRLVLPHAKRGLAMVAARTGHPETARAIFDEALPLFRRIGDENCISICHLVLGELEIDAGDHVAAELHLRRSLEGFAKLGGPLNLAPVIRRTGELAAASGNYQRAATLLGAAEAIRESTGGVMGPSDQARYATAAESSREALGTGDFEALRKQGAGMSIEEAVSYVTEAPV